MEIRATDVRWRTIHNPRYVFSSPPSKQQKNRNTYDRNYKSIKSMLYDRNYSMPTV
jgi:hypothetical protein